MSEGWGGERTGRAALVMSVGTFFSRLTGFGRVVALAYALGLTHRLTDAYNLANTTPNIVFDFVLGGVLSATLIPVFVDRLATRKEAEAWRAISAVFSLVTVLLVVMTALFEVASPELIRIYTFGTAHSAAEDHAATGLLRMFAPQLAFYGWIVLSTALLNTRRRFAVPMFTPIANNVLVIFVLLVVRHIAHGMSVGNVSSHAGAYWLLGLGTTAGVAVQLVGQLPALRGAGIRLSWVWDPGHEVVRQMLRLSGWTFGFVATNQVALWVVLLLANRRTGDVTVWMTAYTFFQLPYGIAAVSLMSAIQPALADSWARHRLVAFRRRMAGGLRAMLSLVVPAAVAYLLLSRPGLEVVLRHGATTTTGADRAAVTTALLAVGLPGFCVFQLLVRSYQAMKDARTPFLLYLLENGINIVGAIALYPSLGVRGLALSVSIAYTAAAGVALVSLRRRLDGIEGGRLLAHLGRVGVPTLVMALGVALVGAVITGQSTAVLAGRLVLAVAVGGGAYLATAGVMAGVMARGRAA